MANRATIRSWSDDGWGVIDSPETPGGCWAHFSNAAVDGCAGFIAGQEVWLEWESPGQDGFGFRATRFWPADADPRERLPGPGNGAYHSTLSLHFDDPSDAGRFPL